MAAYSFKDILATISGTGGQIDLTGCSSEEGITIVSTGDKDVMTIGAGGCVMHSLKGDDSGTITVNLLKTSEINSKLMQMYNTQKASSATWGDNTISVKDVARGDDITASEVAFGKPPDLNYASEGGIVSWPFYAGKIEHVLGSGTAEKQV